MPEELHDEMHYLERMISCLFKTVQKLLTYNLFAGIGNSLPLHERRTLRHHLPARLLAERRD
jgi:hypothetical protein